MKFNQVFTDIVMKNIQTNKIPMLLGEPGIGKSSWVEALAKQMNTKCFTLACNQLADKADLTGARLVPVLDASGKTISYKQVFYPHQVIHDAIAYAKENPRETPILFMDEVNRTTADVTSECLSIPTLRAIGSTKLPDNLRVVLAGNDKGNITTLDEASISRFVLYHVEPDTYTFLEIVNNIHPCIKSVLEQNPNLLFCKEIENATTAEDDDNFSLEDMLESDDAMKQITTPRSIEALNVWLNECDNKLLMSLLSTVNDTCGEQISMLEECVRGHVGKTAFTTSLLAELSNHLISSQQIHTHKLQTPTKPALYDKLKTCTTLDELDMCIQDLTDREKSACLVFALYEKEDNETIIKQLAPHIPMLEGDHTKMLIELVNANALDKQNTEIFLSLDTQITMRLSLILKM